MAATIVTKNSSTAGAAPTAGDLVQGELAVNVTDKRLYTENASGTVVELGTNPSVPVTFPDGSASAPSLTNDGDTNTGVYFPAADTVGITTGGTERVRVDSSGNVGIGTSSPGAKLHVSGSSASNSTIDVIAVNTQSSTTAALTSTGSTYSFAGVGANTAWFSSSGTVALGNYSAYPIQFVTNGAERARIDSSGNLLVGGTSYFGAGLSLGSPATSGCASIFAAGGTGNHFRFGNVNNGIVGSISTSTTTTTYSTSSDYRLKENIEPMTGALQKVAALKPVTYTWKADGSEGQGFIAHELAEVCPDAVSGEKDAVDADGNPVYQGIDVSFLVGTLTAAIQEQQAIITKLQADVAALKAA